MPGATAAPFAAVRGVEGVTVAERRNRGTRLAKCSGNRRGGYGDPPREVVLQYRAVPLLLAAGARHV